MPRRPRSAANGDGRPVKVGPDVYRIFWMEAGKRRSERVRGSLADARAAQQRRRADAGAIAERGGPQSVAEWVEHWLATSVRDVLAPETVALYEGTLRRHVLPKLGAVELSRLAPAAVEAWQASLPTANLKATAHRVLRSSLSHAVRTGVLTVHPMRGVKRPRIDRPDVQPFTADELGRLLPAVDAAPSGDRMGVYVRLILTTGLRQGEANGLDWPHVRLPDASLRVDRTQADRGCTLGPPKSSAGRRTVPLTPDLVQRLEQYRDRQRAAGLLSAGRVFTVGEGEPLTRNVTRKIWLRTCKRADVPHRAPHHLRHTYATRMLIAGVPIHEVSALLGHASIQITLDLYAHWMPDTLGRARDAAAQIFG